MSEDLKITSVEKNEKVKDPRRVEAGKRLAAISRQAKERKAKEREAESSSDLKDSPPQSEPWDLRMMIGAVGTAAAVIGLYLSYSCKQPPKNSPEDFPKDFPKDSVKHPPSNPPKNTTSKSKLDSLD